MYLIRTQICGLQECASVPLFIPTDPPTTPPYTLIVYSQIPKLYPLTVEHGTAYWTVVYSAGRCAHICTSESLLMRCVCSHDPRLQHC